MPVIRRDPPPENVALSAALAIDAIRSALTTIV